MNEPTKTRREIEAHIIAQTWKDEAYKQELFINPKAVIEREFGTQFPSHVNVQVLEENPTTFYLVLPQPPGTSGMELSEEQLEAIAGGSWLNVDIKGTLQDIGEGVSSAYNTVKDLGAEAYRAVDGGC
jgi:hypothetical protein